MLLNRGLRRTPLALALHGFALACAVITQGLCREAIAKGEYGNCELYGSKGVYSIRPTSPGQLTIEVNLPAPEWWNGDTPERIRDGFEYCMAANIAWRAGLDRLKVVNVPLEALVMGQTRGFDLALSEISITPERAKVVSFSIPYFNSDIGVLVRRDTAVSSNSIHSLQLGAQEATPAVAFIQDKLLPLKPLKVFPDTASLFTALAARQIDAVLTDTAILLGEAAQTDGALRVAGQYSTGERYGAIYPPHSANEKVLNAIIESMMRDGTLEKLSTRYLAATWGTEPAKIPYFNLAPGAIALPPGSSHSQ
jgi:polar amino acid transport system substrate-binding protein